MKAHHLGHVVFYVKDLKRSVEFYGDLLGFNKIGTLTLPFKAAAFTSGRTHHEILLIEVGEAPRPPQGHRIGLYHVGIKIGDSLDELRSARDELIEAGGKYCWDERSYDNPKHLSKRPGWQRSRALCG